MRKRHARRRADQVRVLARARVRASVRSLARSCADQRRRGFPSAGNVRVGAAPWRSHAGDARRVGRGHRDDRSAGPQARRSAAPSSNSSVVSTPAARSSRAGPAGRAARLGVGAIASRLKRAAAGAAMGSHSKIRVPRLLSSANPAASTTHRRRARSWDFGSRSRAGPQGHRPQVAVEPVEHFLDHLRTGQYDVPGVEQGKSLILFRSAEQPK